ncbi:MAG: hypothetical protein HPY87_08835 [Fervidobacterium sp.]|uniref:hypothetical protein n=1 Tax=Fervidobacterium sp. TaxID=1871331 RepID=UPI0025BE388D|nr:hypothetical protein [Fervidobacterium sp.]NPU89965.1 hypothetical protein [Fervidobacterium sp.]
MTEIINLQDNYKEQLLQEIIKYSKENNNKIQEGDIFVEDLAKALNVSKRTASDRMNELGNTDKWTVVWIIHQGKRRKVLRKRS